MKTFATFIITILAMASISCHAVSGDVAKLLSKEIEKACRSDVAKVNKAATKKTTNAYCKCFAEKTISGINEEDLGVLLTSGDETPNFSSVSDESAMICGRIHFGSSGVAAKYEDLPDMNINNMTRTKSGVFAVKPTSDMPGLSTFMDSEKAYGVIVNKDKKLMCGWGSESADNKSSSEIMTNIKKIWPTFAKTFMGSQNGGINELDEIKVRGNPAVFMEIVGERENLPGEIQPIVSIVTIMIETRNNAIVTGFCTVDSNYYESTKSAMNKLAVSAMSSRVYK